jgi:exopolyphosphatase/guanosine-5'-triphosphate,3'-diphosphate pyrophosphatase
MDEDESHSETGRPCAVLDVGTNSVLLLVASGDATGGLVVVREAARITRLGDGLAETGLLRPEAIRRTVEACRDFADTARSCDARAAVAVGTEAARAALNADALREAIEALGIPFRRLRADEEARLSYAGVRSGLALAGPVCVADVGGGSTELILGEGDDVRASVSVPVGCLRTPLGPPRDDPERIDAARCALADSITGFAAHGSAAQPVGVGGTVTTCAALEARMTRYVSRRIHGVRLGKDAIGAWIRRLRGMTVEERSRLPGMATGRETSLLCGLNLVDEILTVLAADGLVVSTTGLRHGVLLRLLVSGGR